MTGRPAARALALAALLAGGAPPAAAQEAGPGSAAPPPVAGHFQPRPAPIPLLPQDLPMDQAPPFAAPAGVDGVAVEQPVETTIIIGDQGRTRSVTVVTRPEDSGIQINVPRLDDASRARLIAKENLERGEVGTADRLLDGPVVLVPGDVRTTIRVDDVIARSRNTSGSACIQIGTVGRQTECTDKPAR